MNKTIDEVYGMCESRYGLVTMVARRAREITDDAIKHGDILIEKPVNIVLGNLKSGRATIVRGSAATSLYKDEDFEVSISVEPEAESSDE